MGPGIRLCPLGPTGKPALQELGIRLEHAGAGKKRHPHGAGKGPGDGSVRQKNSIREVTAQECTGAPVEKEKARGTGRRKTNHYEK